MNAKLHVAVVGCGIGRQHIAAYRNLPDHYDVLAVCDVNVDKARAVARDAGVPRVSADLSELCAMSDLDVIDLCTPPGFHFAQILQVLAAGKHCICEKPLVGSLREVDELMVAEARAGKRMMPIFQYRFGHGLQKLKLLIDKGVAGRAYVSNIDLAWRRRAEYYAVPWRNSWETELGGTLTGHAIHALDMLMYAIGPVKNVFARAKTLVNPIRLEDCAAVSLEMADGSLATMSVTLGSAVEITRHRLCFSNLVAESNTRPYTNSHDPWTFTGDTPELQALIDQTLAGFDPQPERFEGQFLLFHKALQQGGDPPVTLSDARRAVEILTAMYKSARTNQDISLPLPKDEWYNGWRPTTGDGGTVAG